MNEVIKSVLKRLENEGFEAYVVGGYVRDYCLEKKSYDVDIITNALPKDIVSLFAVDKVEIHPYKSINFKQDHYNFDIMTYRREIKYKNRIPVEIEYINNLLEDLERRDFKINALLMNHDGKVIDYMDALTDLKNNVITSIGNVDQKLKEDPLRILRAIRIATILDFKLDKKLFRSIKKHKKLILKLSVDRIRKELDVIFLSKNYKKGFQLLIDCGILKVLGIKPKVFNYVHDISAIWLQINSKIEFNFTKQEKKQMESLKKILAYGDIDAWIVYEYGLYLSQVAAELMHKDKHEVVQIAAELSIQEESELAISSESICEVLGIEPSKMLGLIKDELIKLILKNKINNNEKELISYLKERRN